MTKPLLPQSEAPGIGTLLSTIETFGGNPAGTTGIVYHTELDKNVVYTSILLENGHDIGAFTPVELAMTTQAVGQTDCCYQFTTPAALQRDFARGYFASAFAGQPASSSDEYALH